MAEHFQISLAGARREAHYTQEAAAEKMGVTKQTIVNWEKGTTEPTIKQAEEMCALYGRHYDDIFWPCKSN